MNLEDQIEKVILDPNVSRSIKTCLKSENESGFLVYLAQDGSVHQGKIVCQNQKRIRALQNSGLSSLDSEFIPMCSQFALEELSSYIEAYGFQNMLRTDKKSGLLVLTKWRIDEVDDEATEILKQKLSDGETTTHPSILHLSPTAPDRLELNQLRKTHNNVAIVRGTRLSKDEPYTRLLVVKQIAPHMSGGILRDMMLEVGYGPLLSGDLWKKYYQKLDGILDLDQRFLDIEEV